MGNCITSKAILAENQKDEPPREAKTLHKTSSAGQSSAIRTAKSVKNTKEKSVRFRLHQEDTNNAGESCRETKSGVVRIRLVLTQNEANQILNSEFKQHSSAEQLLNIIKSRSKRVSPDGSVDSGRNGNWIPALESIPEDH